MLDPKTLKAGSVLKVTMEIVEIDSDGNIKCDFFDGDSRWFDPSLLDHAELAYAPEPTPEVKEEYVPPTTCSNKSHAVEHVEYKPGEIAMCAHRKVPWSSVEEYVPMVGDRVSLEGEVVEDLNGAVFVRLIGGEISGWVRVPYIDSIKLLSRKYPRKITRKEIEEIVGGSFEIVD